jgi:hypothetical protein
MLGMHGVRFKKSELQGGSLEFTFFYPQENRWEGHDYQITLGQ